MKKKFRLRKDRPTPWIRQVSLKRGKPFSIWYRIIDENYGVAYCNKPQKGVTTMYIRRKSKGYCGYDTDRHRFIVRRQRGRGGRRHSTKYGWRKEAYR